MKHAIWTAIKQHWLVILLAILLAVCLLVTIWAVWFRGAEYKELTPDYAPPYDDENAVPIPGDEDEKFESEAGGGAVRLMYSEKVTIDLSEKTAYLSYANPGKSTQNVVLQIIVKDEIVAQSGLIKTGFQIGKLKLLEGADKMLREGIYVDAVFRFLCYDPVSAEKAMLHTDAKIAVTVKK